MKKYDMIKIVAGQRGIALVSALMLLVIVSLLAVAVSMDTSMDVRIAAYQRFKANSFGFSESGLIAAADILEENAEEKGWRAPPIPFPNVSPNYVGSIQIVGPGDFYMEENLAGNPTMTMRGDIEADIVTQRVISKLADGSSFEMLTGYEGAAESAAAGGVHVVHNVFADGRGLDNAETRSGIYYRLVVY